MAEGPVIPGFVGVGVCEYEMWAIRPMLQGIGHFKQTSGISCEFQIFAFFSKLIWQVIENKIKSNGPRSCEREYKREKVRNYVILGIGGRVVGEDIIHIFR